MPCSAAPSPHDSPGLGGVWEITHIGSHRFAPTLRVLPHGYAYGGTDAPHVKQILDALREGRLVTDVCRGRSPWERPGQAAELAVRRATGQTAANALSVVGTDGSAPRWEVTVRNTDGRLWCITVAQSTSLPPRAESCGAVPGSTARVEGLSVRELTTT